MTHTTGPCEISSTNWEDCAHGIYSGEENSYLAVTLNGPNADEDARLIAAAPDMYDALEWLADEVEEPEALAVIRQALAKARGE